MMPITRDYQEFFLECTQLGDLVREARKKNDRANGGQKEEFLVLVNERYEVVGEIGSLGLSEQKLISECRERSARFVLVHAQRRVKKQFVDALWNSGVSIVEY